MKKIVINDYQKFINTANKPEFHNLYRHGYWNVLQHNKELETFLINSNISHLVQSV